MSESCTCTRRHRGWWRSAPIVVAAVLVLIVSTAGGAYAVAKNSVGNAQLKSNAVTTDKVKNSTLTTSDVQNDSLTTSDVKEGSLRLTDVQATERPLRMYAGIISSDGTLRSGSPGVSHVVKNTTGYWTVYFSVGIEGCVVVTSGSGTTINTTSTMGSGLSFFVFARNVGVSGAPYADTDVSFTVSCY